MHAKGHCKSVINNWVSGNLLLITFKFALTFAEAEQSNTVEAPDASVWPYDACTDYPDMVAESDNKFAAQGTC